MRAMEREARGAAAARRATRRARCRPDAAHAQLPRRAAIIRHLPPLPMKIHAAAASAAISPAAFR